MNIEGDIYPELDTVNSPIIIPQPFPENHFISLHQQTIIKPQPIRVKRKIPLNICITSIGLNILGNVFLTMSIDFYIENPEHEGSLPMLILACLTFIPGIYSAFILYGIIRKWNGYNINSISSYEQL